ncbi:GRAM domain-containing 1B [Brachionus plicatilis]|uniref:GRAM domain-containing 1B n=1 Tax=Brachionus plicatilis TaxID=10195 RepID=A0A3M7PG94_BRAPC|nr:GRAM domain-containing 1B [Brachionus plicatilis]
MVVEKNTKNHLLLSNTWSAASPVSLSNEISTESSDKSSQSTDVNNNEQKSDPKSQSNFSNFSPIANNSQASKKVDLSSSMIGQTSMVSPSPVTSSPSEPVEVADLNINNNAKCSCTEHNGKELMNLTFNMSVNQLFESLFGHTEFCRKYWESRKFGNLIVGEWNNEPVLPARRLEYTVDLGGALGRPKNTEDQKILEYRSEVCIVMESSSVTHNVPYSDYFVVKNRFCITRITANQTRVIVNCHIFYKKNPNFIIKNFIEKNSISAIKDSFLYIASIVNQFHDEKCHESTFNKIGLENSSNSEICSSDFKEKNLPECKKLPEKTGTISAFKTEKDEISHIDSLDIETRIRTDHKTKPSNKKILKKRHANHTGENRNDQVFEFVVQRSNSENNPIPERSTSNQPQLVPLHKFSFFGIEINVDTIVRLFIVAMVCLMIINGVLYYKLRRIESLADSLKSDPNLLYKSGQFDQALTDLSFEEQNNWQLAIKNTLEAISKMEYSLKQLNKNFESHEPEEL